MDANGPDRPLMGQDQTVLQVSPLELFKAFMGVGLSGFGGVLPFARRMLVERRRWLSTGEFTEILGLSQLLPGPNVVNITIYVGARFAGVPGVLAALAGLMLMPFVLIIALGVVYDRYGDLPMIANAIRGVASAAAGLVTSMAVKIAWPVLRSVHAVTVALLVFVAITILKLPLVWVILVLMPASVFWMWWRTP
jgi:chromate transporter